MPEILDGAAIVDAIKQEVAEQVRALAGQGIRPGLAAVLVGNVAASEIYVRSKVKTCAELGIYSDMITPPAEVTTEEMLALVAALNSRDEIDGILIQLPLPKHVDTKALLDAVSPEKDVDGFHPVNAGRLQAGRPALAPCTPTGIIEILKRSGIAIAGKHAVVVGRSDIVGKPAAMLLLNEDATVTICHSKTQDLAAITRQADILVAAIGRPGFITRDMVKPGATLIDVGINRITTREEFDLYFKGDAKREATFAKRGSTIVGDIHPKAFELAGAYTPVPGGVGPLTIAMLMSNTVRAAEMRRKLPRRGLKPMLRVGLTGGLGSGKSTVAAMLRELGAEVIEADTLGRKLMEPGERVFDEIVRVFGREVVGPDGKLNRARLAEMAFGEGRLQELNAIVHPATIALQKEWMDEVFRRNPKAVAVVESALIFEVARDARARGESDSELAGWRQRFDRMIVVTAPDELKITRYVSRVNPTLEGRAAVEADARRRLAHQIPDAEKAAHADFVLDNSGDRAALKAQVDALWPRLLKQESHSS